MKFERKIAKPMTEAQYNSAFGSEEQRKEAYEMAWKLRFAENELYWKRTFYFGGFISVIFIAYANVLAGENINKSIEFCLTLLGLVFSLAWLLSNFSSKMYRNNFTEHIKRLGSSKLLEIRYVRKYSIFRGYADFKINQFMIFVIMVFWGLLFSKTIFDVYGDMTILKCLKNCISYIPNSVLLLFLILLTIGLLCFLLFFCRVDAADKDGYGFVDTSLIKQENA